MPAPPFPLVIAGGLAATVDVCTGELTSGVGGPGRTKDACEVSLMSLCEDGGADDEAAVVAGRESATPVGAAGADELTVYIRSRRNL